MNASDLLATSAPLHGTRAPDHHSPLNLNLHSARLWKQSGLSQIGAERLARNLAWFSIGLGLTELLAPRLVNRLCGGHGHRTLSIRLKGLREIASGLAIFSGGRKPANAVWSRVAGDTVDLATLVGALAMPSTNKLGVLLATTSVLGVTALDIMTARELSIQRGKLTEAGAIRLKRSVVVNRSAEDIYQYWRNLENLPRFMTHLQSVRELGNNRSHWVTSGPAGKTFEWDAQITEDVPNELIAWRSDEASEIYNAGAVRFEARPGGRGTIVRVDMEYYPPGGFAGTAVAMMFNQSPEQQIYDDLKRLKQVLETGEVVRSDGSPDGAGSRMTQRPAQPLPRV